MEFRNWKNNLKRGLGQGHRLAVGLENRIDQKKEKRKIEKIVPGRARYGVRRVMKPLKTQNLKR